MSADGNYAFVTAPEGKELVVVDAATRQVVKRIKVGDGPLGVAAHPTNGRVYVADWYQHKVFVVDPVAGAIVAEIQVGKSPSGLAVTPDGRLLLSADRDSNEVSFIDAADERAARRRQGRRAPLRHHHRCRRRARLHG